MSHLSRELQLRVLAALVDGNSERAAERMTGVNARTIRKFAVRVGQGAARLHDRLARDMSCSMLQIDEIWGWVKKKQARVDPLKDLPEVGDNYTFVGMDQASRFVVSFLVGKRDQTSADAFIADLRSRLVVMPMITSDGFPPYISSIYSSFGPMVDYAMYIKNYRTGARPGPDHRYEPPRDPFVTKKPILGAPDLDRATTAHVERNNGTMRHHIGRMRRLCYAFSKKLVNHGAAVALNYVHYNLCLIVKTLRVTPAVAAGVTNHIWELDEFLDACLSAAKVAPPEVHPLTPRVPEQAARRLPNGRGFLRVVPTSGQPKPPQLPPATPPTPPVAAAAGPPAAPASPPTPSTAPATPNPPGSSPSEDWEPYY